MFAALFGSQSPAGSDTLLPCTVPCLRALRGQRVAPAGRQGSIPELTHCLVVFAEVSHWPNPTRSERAWELINVAEGQGHWENCDNPTCSQNALL